mmetsp:Transcript_33041/g.69347  ORF Transcript_33041/g.69347 Transcript_33041/m.69347 type:complete len:1474 (+) Transcript_33041:52-4473(+)
MGLFNKLKPSSSSNPANAALSKNDIPTAIEFSMSDGGGTNSAGEFGSTNVSESADSSGMGGDSMVGQGMNTRQGGHSEMIPQTPMNQEWNMVGQGINSRQLSPKEGNPFDSSEEGSSDSSGSEIEINNAFDAAGATKPPSKKPPQKQKGGLQQFEESMKAMEEKLSRIDNSKFIEFAGDADSSATPLSGIDEEMSRDLSGGGGYGTGGRNSNTKGGGGRMGSSNIAGSKRELGKKKKSGLKKFFKRGGSKDKKKTVAPEPRQHHRPAIDSDSEGDYSEEHDNIDEEDDGSYISGEFDEEFDNSDGFVPDRDTRDPNSRNHAGNNMDAPIGVPNGRGAQLTSRQLEDELYLYKLETLNLTDACRELAEQLEEVESKLESVQAQATFRIHALEAELQDGHHGMKSLVKMTSVEMDGRLDALRALGKTAMRQAAKLKERDSELILVDRRLRKTRRDIKSLKRENKKVGDEKTYLKSRLDELEKVKIGLEEDLKQLAMENTSAAVAMSAEEKEMVENMKKKLNDTLEQVAYTRSQLAEKDEELDALKRVGEEKEGEILEMKEELDRKEHDIVRVEHQLEKVRNDLLDAATAAERAEEARVEAEARESSVRQELDEALGCLEEVTTKVAILESAETKIKQQLKDSEANLEDTRHVEEQRARLAELEEEVNRLLEEKEGALEAVNNAQAAYAETIAEKNSQINTLNKDVDVHREQMELAQTMLEEKEMLANELRSQLEDTMKEEEMRVAQLEENLAAKSREVANVTVELEERTKYVGMLEERLDEVMKEFNEHRADADAAAAAAAKAKAEASKDEDEAVQSAAAIASANTANAAQIAEQRAELAKKESQIERLERALGTGKRNLDATRVELEEKDKHAERLKAELERLKTEKGVKVEELEAQLEEKNQSIDALRKDLESEKQSLDVVVAKMSNVQIDLDTALDATHAAEDARERAVSEMEASKSAERSAMHETEKLKSQIELLQKANDSVVADVRALKLEADKEKKSSTQAAATLAATNAARQAEMEMKIEKMQKEIEFKKREIDAIKSELKEKDQTTKRLKTELQDAKEDLIHFKENVEKEKEKEKEEKEADALQRVADRDYFDEEKVPSVSSAGDNTYSTAGENTHASRGVGLLGGLFNRSTNNVESTVNNIDWEAKLREKDARIAQLEKSLADNALSISNLKNELVTASSKFKDDESQRRLLIQRLENENQAYSIKLEVLETEFEEIRKRKEAVAVAKSNNSFLTDDGSVASSVHSNQSGSSRGSSQATSVTSTSGTHKSSGGSSMTGVSSITGISRLTPLERDNKKLKKQKKVYETRIASLQTQLSEIQQIVPELMSKSKSQIQKLETVVETQRQEAEEKEEKLEEEITKLRQQNEQLQAATRSRLQSSDVDRQEEIDQLKMRLEAREATIKKLEMLASSGKSLRRKGGKILRKKKMKDPNNDGEVSVLSESSSWAEQQSVAAYSVATDSVFGEM